MGNRKAKHPVDFRQRSYREEIYVILQTGCESPTAHGEYSCAISTFTLTPFISKRISILGKIGTKDTLQRSDARSSKRRAYWVGGAICGVAVLSPVSE